MKIFCSNLNEEGPSQKRTWQARKVCSVSTSKEHPATNHDWRGMASCDKNILWVKRCLLHTVSFIILIEKWAWFPRAPCKKFFLFQPTFLSGRFYPLLLCNHAFFSHRLTLPWPSWSVMLVAISVLRDSWLRKHLLWEISLRKPSFYILYAFLCITCALA